MIKIEEKEKTGFCSNLFTLLFKNSLSAAKSASG
jgi:hypothetical protein